MNKKIIATVVAASAALLPGYAMTQSWDGFNKRVYFGVGAGQSNLNPDTSEAPDVSLIESKDTAGLVTLGFDLSRRISAELQFADLGLAETTGEDGIEYAVPSLTGLYYLWNGLGSSDYLDADGLDQRTGLSLYGRAGVGKMENESLRTVEYVRENSAQFVAGLGLEYSMSFGLGIRAEYIHYDSDAQYGGVSLLYRIGLSNATGGTAKEAPEEITPETVPDLPVLPAPEPEETLPPPPPPPPPPAVESDDNDSDGVSNAFDECTSTSPGTPVGSNGCAMFNGTLEGVNFLTGSDVLTDSARRTLDEVVDTLNSFPDIRVSVEAHTDSMGDDAINMNLSRQRALAVVRYLVAQGIALEQLEARAFGESRPIADNNTRAGRQMNRRVEFQMVQ